MSLCFSACPTCERRSDRPGTKQYSLDLLSVLSLSWFLLGLRKHFLRSDLVTVVTEAPDTEQRMAANPTLMALRRQPGVAGQSPPGAQASVRLALSCPPSLTQRAGEPRAFQGRLLLLSNQACPLGNRPEGRERRGASRCLSAACDKARVP